MSHRGSEEYLNYHLCPVRVKLMLFVLMCCDVKVKCVGFRGRNGIYNIYNNVFYMCSIT